ncbi:hypothetical protein HPB52_001748 [Rhipicephalus sanguineus]|uniref:Uncharacterized protein n=1 Tax=Rhipicephalus sanguineus TaxID=34632 RepID=A0A9D4QJL4_RHISA|nr:hypothetical protein HPB52_001748 [Rhipicephalus sanguineus]
MEMDWNRLVHMDHDGDADDDEIEPAPEVTDMEFGAPFMPSNQTRIVVPFPPTEDEAEKEHRQKFKQRYEKMHEALERSDAEYMDILRAAGCPCPTYDIPFNPWIAKVLDSTWISK